MTGQHLENFQNLRAMLKQVATDMNCNVVSHRTSRASSIYFELIPDGCAYGPQIRINDAQIRDGRFMDQFLSEQPLLLTKKIKERMQLQEDMKDSD